VSDLGWTRLTDLVAIGYSIEARRSTHRFCYLRHTGGHAPDIGLWADGSVEPLGEPLWPAHLTYEHSISARPGARFQQFCRLHDYPTRQQERRYHIRKLLELFPTVCWIMRVAGALRWHLVDRHR
jgi:hypothetical protein